MSSDHTGTTSATDDEKARIVRALYDIADRLVQSRDAAGADGSTDPCLNAAFEDLIREARALGRPGFADKVEAAARYMSGVVSAGEPERDEETSP